MCNIKLVLCITVIQSFINSINSNVNANQNDYGKNIIAINKLKVIRLNGIDETRLTALACSGIAGVIWRAQSSHAS